MFPVLNEIVIPRQTLIVLCGPAASGKSSWAAKHFTQTQVVSSDECRGLICDDPANQTVTPLAFELMYSIIDKRLHLGRLTIADATNLKREHRRHLIEIANRVHFNAVAIVFNLPMEICAARNAGRARKVPEEALLDQFALLQKTLRKINNERFNAVYTLDQYTEETVSVQIT